MSGTLPPTGKKKPKAKPYRQRIVPKNDGVFRADTDLVDSALGLLATVLMGSGWYVSSAHFIVSGVAVGFLAVYFRFTFKKHGHIQPDYRIAGLLIAFAAGSGMYGTYRYVYPRQEPQVALAPKSVQTTMATAPTPAPRFRLVGELVTEDLGLEKPLSKFMVRYRFNGLDTISPIDWIFKFHLVNLQSTAAVVEDYEFSALQNDGRWVVPFEIPQDHLSVYAVLLQPWAAGRLEIKSFANSVINTSIPPNGEVSGIALFECPQAPQPLKKLNDDNWLIANTCFGRSISIRIKERSGAESVVEAEFDQTHEGVPVTISHEKPVDLRNARIVRPFPSNLVWSVPDKGMPQAFDNSGPLKFAPTPKPSRRNNRYEL